MLRVFFCFLLGVLLFSPPLFSEAPFREYPIGEPVEKSGMQIQAVYLPPIEMEGDGSHDLDPLKKEKGYVIHIEADVHALPGNKNGFGAGDWIPGLQINYVVTHVKRKKSITGKFVPMLAKDGPHYGATITLPEKGDYAVTYLLNPPKSEELARHVDSVTGVPEWWKPFKVDFSFLFNGFEKE